MAKNFSVLRKKMSPASRKRSQALAKRYRTEIDGYLLPFNPTIAQRLCGITIQPTGSRILLEFAAPEFQTLGGLFIPDSVQKMQKPGQARHDTGIEAFVLAVGPGRWYEKLWKRIPCSVKAGDRILITPLNFPIKMGRKLATDWRTGATTQQDREVYLVDEAAVLGTL